MDIVSCETGLRLKESGFNIPEASPFQAWFTPDGVLRFVTIDETDRHVSAVLFDNALSGRCFTVSEIVSDWVFAPTATDILKELQFDYVLRFKAFTPEFQCFDLKSYFISGETVIYSHVNPAEACALAWLSQNEKK